MGKGTASSVHAELATRHGELRCDEAGDATGYARVTWERFDVSRRKTGSRPADERLGMPQLYPTSAALSMRRARHGAHLV